MFRAPHIISGWEWFPVFDRRGKPTFHKHLKWSLPSEIGMWEGLCVFCLKWNDPWCPDSKKGGVSLHLLKCMLIFHLPRRRDDRIPCGVSRESHSPPPLLDRRPHILLTHREVRWVHCFKRWWCLTLRENWRNTSITLPINKGSLASHLTSSSVRIVLPRLV